MNETHAGPATSVTGPACTGEPVGSPNKTSDL